MPVPGSRARAARSTFPVKGKRRCASAHAEKPDRPATTATRYSAILRAVDCHFQGGCASTWIATREYICCLLVSGATRMNPQTSMVSLFATRVAPDLITPSSGRKMIVAHTAYEVISCLPPILALERFPSLMLLWLIGARFGTKTDSQAVKAINSNNGQRQIYQFLLRELLVRLLIDLVRHMPLRDQCHRLGPRQRCPLTFRIERRFA